MVAQRLYALAEAHERVLDASKFTSAVAAFAVPAPAAAEDDDGALTAASADDPVDALAPPPRPQHMRAYTFWHRDRRPFDDIRAALRTRENPLAASTVMCVAVFSPALEPKRRADVCCRSYVIGALQADTSLPYSMPDLIALVQLEIGSWSRYREWILKQGPKGRL